MKVAAPSSQLPNMISDDDSVLQNLLSEIRNLQDKRQRITWDSENMQSQSSWISRVDDIIEKGNVLLSTNNEARGTCRNLWWRYRLNKEVRKLKQEISQLYEEGAKYYNPKSRTKIIDDIVAALNDPHNQTVGVWGLGGGGTTSLAKQIREQVKKQGLFSAVVITTIAEEPNVEKIQKAIANVLCLWFHGETHVERKNKLQQRIKKEKKILVIVDDIWGELNAHKFDLEEIGIPLGDEHKECKLLITSANLDFLKNMRGVSKVFQLEVLLEDEALSLFEKIVGNVNEDSKARSLAMEIVRSCAGSTLSIFVIAKALRNKGLDAWQDALKQLKQHVSPIKICLDSLQSEELKYLLLLLTIRGKRAIHKSNVLFDMWTCLFKSLGTLEAARIRLDSLIIDAKAYGFVVEDGKEWVRIVDSIWETVYSIAQNDLKALMISGSWPLEEWLRILHFCSVTISSGFKILERLPCPELEEIVLHTQSPSMQVPNSFFEETKLLKALDFVGFDCSKLPISIGLLKNLQALSMSNCKLRDITLLGNLTNLQILRLQGSHTQQFPRQIGQLQKLRFLDLRDTYLQVIPPNVLENLTSLEELYLRNSFSNWEVERSNNEICYASLKELTNLNHLVHLEDLYVPNHQAWPVDLLFEKLKSYTIFIGDGWGQTHDGDHSLKTLKLKLNRRFESEEKIKKMLKFVNVLYLDELNGVQNVVSDLANDGFPYLKSLVVQHNAEIKCIAMGLPSQDVFHNLESLSLYNLSNLEHICDGVLSETSFFKLRAIKVHKCDGISYLFKFPRINSFIHDNIGRLTSFLHLVDIEISECKEIYAVLYEHVLDWTTLFSELRYLTLRGLPNFITFCFNSFYSTKLLFDGQLLLEKLKVLRVINMDIKQLWNYSCPPKSFRELEDLTLSDNNKLLSVVSSRMIRRFNNLKKLIVHSCKLLTTVFNLEDDKPDQTIETMFPLLMALELSNLCSLRDIWDKEPKVPFFQNLVSLQIVHCNHLKKVFSVSAVKKLTQLKLLKIYKCKSMIEVIDGGEDEILPITFANIECLILKDLPKLIYFYGQSIRTFNWPKLQTIRVSNVSCMVTFCDRHLNTPLLRKVFVTFVKGCWHGDLNKTIRHLNGYAALDNVIFFDSSPYRFSDKDLLNPSTEVLGEGSHGRTYKVVMDNGTIVVVKRLKDPTKKNWLKLETLGRIGRHPNVMPLQAFYYSKDEIFLVYDYMPEGSLYHWLHGDKVKGRNQLDWDSRVKVALGAAKGIDFIHSQRGPYLTHGNIKSTNVLITKNHEDAYISDVGMITLMNSFNVYNVFRAPEVTHFSQITQSSDVYSFGVLLYEMLTDDNENWFGLWGLGRARNDTSWVGKVLNMELQQQNKKEMVKMLQVALACTEKVPEKRPRMEVVVRMVEEIKQPS